MNVQTIQTRIRFNVWMLDNPSRDPCLRGVNLIITSNEELTMEELEVISGYAPDFIRNKSKCEHIVKKLKEKLARMRKPHSQAIKYANLLKKIKGVDYEFLKQ